MHEVLKETPLLFESNLDACVRLYTNMNASVDEMR